MRGEHSGRTPDKWKIGGSSPPARGTLQCAQARQGLRFIPACAGNTCESARARPPRAVHPRPRGEHHSRFSFQPAKFGPSPPARATHAHRDPNHGRLRSIPAGAGNTRLRRMQALTLPVHPRLRRGYGPPARLLGTATGSCPPAREHSVLGANIGQAFGSSPLPGEHLRIGVERFKVPFIPACAGNTRCRRDRRAGSAVHPRLRGEHANALASKLNKDGSSPPARGTLAVALLDDPFRRFIQHVSLSFAGAILRFIPACEGTPYGAQVRRDTLRFIPACAGNTPIALLSCSPFTVHPRLRGEHYGGGLVLPVAHRFIPACAGNTHAAAESRSWEPVIPALRGEHTTPTRSRSASSGSSPPARGTHPPDPSRAGPGRFIPACAGNTRTRSSARRTRTVPPRLRGEHPS